MLVECDLGTVVAPPGVLGGTEDQLTLFFSEVGATAGEDRGGECSGEPGYL
jgi:hypothetical protein